MRVRLLAAWFVLMSASTAVAGNPTSAGTGAQGMTEPGMAAPDQTAMMTPAQARADIRKTFGFVPNFLAVTPDEAVPGAWAEFKGFQMNPNTALPPKTKELIGLAVAAQIPCPYCIYAHTSFAKAAGSPPREIGEAVALAAVTRKWSTVLNGIQTDEGKFKQEVSQWVEHARTSAGQPAPAPQELTTAAAARKDVEQSFGMVPDFIRRYPDQALAGAWAEYRNLALNPNTALSPKEKDLISLGVSSQIPCRYCVIADTEFARFNGATEQEINEAIAMAAITRHWSTMLHGMQMSETQFRKDVDRIVKGMQVRGKPHAQNQPGLK